MRRSLVVGLAFMFIFVLSFGVLAENGDDQAWTSAEYWDEYAFDTDYDRSGDDGVLWTTDTDSSNPGAYTNLKDLDRTGYKFDANVGDPDDDQEVAIKLNVDAYIPCYLEMTLTGNQGTTTGKSFGPDTNPNMSHPTSYLMVFDNEIGGFIDGSWNSMGAGRNAEVEPGNDVYIMACDIYKVDIYGNEDYRYEIEGAALSGMDNGAAALDMQMGTSLNAGDSWGTDFTFDATSGTNITTISNVEATESISALHRFRVPYTRNTEHGRYHGKITFRTVSI